MAENKYVNSVAAMIENAQKTMGELLKGASAATLYGWTIADLSFCNGPAVKMKFKGRIVMYNKAKRIIYIEDMASCVLNDVCGIINDIEWNN